MVLVFLTLAATVWDDNLLRPADWQWLRQWRDVVNNREERLPEVGRYNAGQKLLFFVLLPCLLDCCSRGLSIWRAYFTLPVGLRPAGVRAARRVRVRVDLRDPAAHLRRDLGEGLAARHAPGHRDTGLGVEASPGLVPPDHA